MGSAGGAWAEKESEDPDEPSTGRDASSRTAGYRKSAVIAARRKEVPRDSSAFCLIQLALRLRSNPMDVTATHSRLTSLRAHVYHHQAPTQSVT